MRKPISQLRARVCDGAVELTWYKSTPMFTDAVAAAAELAVFRIRRQRHDAFTFGQDYAEYFRGRHGDETAELVHEGPLEAHNDRKYTFIDDTVEVAATYAYTIQTRTSEPIGPLPVRVRDPEVWWSYDELRSRLAALAGQAPERVRITGCGHSAGGREIPCIEIGQQGPILGLVGLIHAGESGPELIVSALAQLLARRPALFDRARVVALPTVNVDAREQMARGVPWYLRTTPQGVDLNRNFPADWDTVEYGYGLDSSDPDAGTYRGPAPASAPETRAVMAVFEAQRPDAVFSMHCLAGICGMPALAPRKAQEDAAYADRCRALVECYGAGLYGGDAEASGWLHFGTSAGSLPAWLYDLDRIPAFDLEGGRVDAEIPCVTDATDRDLIHRYQDRHARAIEAVLVSWA